MGFPVHQAAHKFTRGTPIVYTNGRWVSTSGAWDAVVDSIQSADIFTAADSGTIDYPFGTVTPGKLVKTSDGTSIGRMVSPGKLLLDRSGSSASTTIINQAKTNNPTLSDLGGQPLSTVLTNLANLPPANGFLRGFDTGLLDWSYDGSQLTALNGTQVTTGTVADARLSSNVALKNIDNAFSHSQVIVGTDAGSVSAGQVTIGGGVVRSAGHTIVGGSLGIGGDPTQKFDVFGSNNVAVISRIVSAGTGLPYFQLVTPGGVAELSANTSGDLYITANSVASNVVRIVRSSAVSDTLVLSAGIVDVGGIAPASVSAGHVAIGGGVVRAATGYYGDGSNITGLNGNNITSGTVVAARLPAFGSAAAGIVPASGGGTTNFLRADGTWAAASGGGGDAYLANTQTFTGNNTFTGSSFNPISAQVAIGGGYVRAYNGVTTYGNIEAVNNTTGDRYIRVGDSGADWRLKYLASSGALSGEYNSIAKWAIDNSGIASFSGINISNASLFSGSVTCSNGLFLAVAEITSSGGTYTANSQNCVIAVTGTLGHTVNLPNAVAKMMVIVKNRSTSSITLAATGGMTIDGSASLSMASNKSYILMTNIAGTLWYIVGTY